MKKIYLAAAIIALIAGFATYFFAQELKKSSVVTGVEMADVVFAVNDIPANTVLTSDMFVVKQMPVTAITYGTVVRVNDVIGLLATEKISAGEQLIAKKVNVIGADTGAGRLSYQLAKDTYAYVLDVDVINGIAGFIKEGDFIDIYDMKLPETPKILLKNVQVLRLADYNANLSQNAGTEITSYSTLILLLNKQEILTLAPYSGGQLRIVLVPAIENADKELPTVEQETVTTPLEIVTNYGMGIIERETTTAAAK